MLPVFVLPPTLWNSGVLLSPAVSAAGSHSTSVGRPNAVIRAEDEAGEA